MLSFPLAQCNYRTGRATGGSEINIGQKTSQDCFIECEKLRKSTYSAINSVSSQALETGSKGDCICHMDSNGVDHNEEWKTCNYRPGMAI